jgi:hypothetical protein
MKPAENESLLFGMKFNRGILPRAKLNGTNIKSQYIAAKLSHNLIWNSYP